MKAGSTPSVNQEADALVQLLLKYRHTFYPVQGEDIGKQEFCLIDLTEENNALTKINFEHLETLNRHIFDFIESKKVWAGVGGYLEDRTIYKRSAVFGGAEPRSIHLGVDLWAPAFTPLHAPLDGLVYSLKDNEGQGDYGPTIILEHQQEGLKFYTLYGHLSRQSLQPLQEGQLIKKGTLFSELGLYPENGDWPPHLHFQIIRDLEGAKGDYPGVAAPSAIEKFKANCPDPNLILNLPCLE